MSIVTISRGAKSGGVALANRLSSVLGYNLLSREVIVESSKIYNIDEEILKREIEKAPTLWQRFTKEHNRYLVLVQCALLRAAKEDNIIYHGYAGQFFFNEIDHVLKIRIEAPLWQRAETVMRELDLDKNAALEYIHKVDNQRKQWVKFLYDKDWNDPSLYDLTVNMNHMTLDTACEIICNTLKREEFKQTPESQKRLNNRSLECEVKAGIVSDNKLFDERIDQKITVTASDDVVVVRGFVRNKRQRDLIENIVSNVKGVGKYQVFIDLASEHIHGKWG